MLIRRTSEIPGWVIARPELPTIRKRPGPKGWPSCTIAYRVIPRAYGRRLLVDDAVGRCALSLTKRWAQLVRQPGRTFLSWGIHALYKACQCPSTLTRVYGCTLVPRRPLRLFITSLPLCHSSQSKSRRQSAYILSSHL